MTSASSVDLAGRRALVVEDQFLIALDLEVMLRTLGARAVDLVTNIPDALAAIARTPPGIAVLDWKLGATNTLPIAEALRAGGIPFVIASGYDDLRTVPELLRSAPYLRKPIALETLRTALAGMPL